MELDIPIVSIDYSLAPEAPFPRAVEEVFYAYCWTLLNHERLGTTAENIILSGFSAGANLAASCIVKCVESGIPVPGSFISVCGALNLSVPQNPSLFTSFMDIFVPFRFLFKMVKSYLVNELAEPANDDDAEMKNPGNFYFSPYYAPDEILKNFPPTRLITTLIDPLCDHSVEFGKKLRALNVDVDVDVLGALPHGFLVFAQVT